MFGELNCEIDIPTLERLRANGEHVTIIDVREPWEREICAVAESVAIPLDELPARAAELEDAGTLVVICHHGVRSLQAAIWLRRQGLDNAVSLSGGIDAWASQVEPTMRRY
ncbi:MAG TPA: rhodanese-like domain-containing protein [Alphaproteobacteria bacterium]|nr:rhodanese-like domain-containing protein [Alphaproteobacteria bacterium]